MDAVWIAIGISAAGFFASIGSAVFIYGVGWGSVKKDIEYMRRDIAMLMSYFKLTPSEQRNDRRR